VRIALRKLVLGLHKPMDVVLLEKDGRKEHRKQKELLNPIFRCIMA